MHHMPCAFTLIRTVENLYPYICIYVYIHGGLPLALVVKSSFPTGSHVGEEFTFVAGRAWEAGKLSLAGCAESDDVRVGFGFGVS